MDMFGISARAIDDNMNIVVYLLGDGVLCTKANQKSQIGQNLRSALKKGVIFNASAKDLRARAIKNDQVEPGVNIIEDFEGEFVDDIMENADRVISW
jgi:sulfur relay protein TusB/DsrH